MISRIDKFLNSISMYRLLLNGLLLLSFLSILFGFLGIIPYSGFSLVVSLCVLILVCYTSNIVFARMFGAFVNKESSFITALILFFILFPPKSLYEISIFCVYGIVAMGSKFVVVYKKKHLFNPAAFSLFILGLFGLGYGIWWAASLVLSPFFLVFTLLIVRKIRRLSMFLVFVTTASLLLYFRVYFNVSIVDYLFEIIGSWPILFLGGVMLTEPITSPGRRNHQIVYAFIVGLLFSSQFSIGPIFSTPEMALIVGNLFSFIVGYKSGVMFTFSGKKEVAKNTFEFILDSTQRLKHLSGQYFEWTLPISKSDTKGNRRFFTIASSPTEGRVKIGVKFPEKMSSFKKELLSLKPGDRIFATHLSGDFVLPNDRSKKLVFIAGGIGITPFRSMIKYLVDRGEKRDIILLYMNKSKEEIAFSDILAEGEEKFGLKPIYFVTDAKLSGKSWRGEVGYLTRQKVTENIPDYKTRLFYLSGPNAMVDSYKKLLLSMGVSRRNIKTDYFPGF